MYRLFFLLNVLVTIKFFWLVNYEILFGCETMRYLNLIKLCELTAIFLCVDKRAKNRPPVERKCIRVLSIANPNMKRSEHVNSNTKQAKNGQAGLDPHVGVAPKELLLPYAFSPCTRSNDVNAWRSPLSWEGTVPDP